jgi:hypothetical protein
MEMLVTQRSSCEMYVRWKSATSANCSWLKPLILRRRRMFAAKRSRELGSDGVGSLEGIEIHHGSSGREVRLTSLKSTLTLASSFEIGNQLRKFVIFGIKVGYG